MNTKQINKTSILQSATTLIALVILAFFAGFYVGIYAITIPLGQ